MQHARLVENPRFIGEPLGLSTGEEEVAAGAVLAQGPRRFHRSIPGYQPTPLYTLPALAEALGIKALLLKDESHRFSLRAFKLLGASFALYKTICTLLEAQGLVLREPEELFRPQLRSQLPDLTFATATDGNHGRAVAWMARMLGQRAEIYLPAHSARARIEAIEAEGARVTQVEGTYDEAVEQVKRDAQRNGWWIISDTSWPGYEQVPSWITQGYSTLFDEVREQSLEQGFSSPDMILLQAGVGALVAAGIQYYGTHRADTVTTAPRIFAVEPLDAACLLESAEAGERRMARGHLQSVMAGLNCGLPSLGAWPLIQAGTSVFVAIDDSYAEAAMCRLFRPLGQDPKIVAGESGAAGLGGLMALCLEAELDAVRSRLALDHRATVLVVNTEGATDPLNFQRIVGDFPYPTSGRGPGEHRTLPAA